MNQVKKASVAALSQIVGSAHESAETRIQAASLLLSLPDSVTEDEGEPKEPQGAAPECTVEPTNLFYFPYALRKMWSGNEIRVFLDDLKEEATERVAKAIYAQWGYRIGWVPWVKGGNSEMQNAARELAAAALR